ncbi:hypothetical protein ZEAMMB73_Zm00001d051656 [Zea mays]|uniref:Uncharacterized protein n=1 Tax=Zea mays TaxID=4577 RepID=A0A1D6Q8U9_MAIZE|nr:hypothetical protein ZEAMMB73_Zm00001d051656 [Zea mays]
MITLDSVFLKRITVLKMEKEVRSPFIFPDVVQEYFISANSEEILGIVRDNWLQSGHENLHNSIDEAIMLKVLIKIISVRYVPLPRAPVVGDRDPVWPQPPQRSTMKNESSSSSSTRPLARSIRSFMPLAAQMLSGSTVGIFPSTYDLWDSLFGKSIIC